MAGKSRGGRDGQSGVITKTAPKTKKPSMYKVLLLNDDYTPMEFVVLVIEKFFNKGREEATRIMLHAFMTAAASESSSNASSKCSSVAYSWCRSLASDSARCKACSRLRENVGTGAPIPFPWCNAALMSMEPVQG